MSYSPLDDHPQTFSHRIRKSLMLQIWRVEQARAIITLFFWSFALAGIFYGRVAPVFDDWFGLDPKNDVILITLILTLLTIVGIVIFGLLYDRVFRMWEFKSRVITAKDVFRHGRMNDKEIPIYEELWSPLVKALNNIAGEDRLNPTVQTLERWVKSHEVVSGKEAVPEEDGTPKGGEGQ